MTAYKIEAGTGQHIGNRAQQNDRAALLTSARAPGYVLAVLSDGVAGAAASEQVLHTAKHVFDLYKPGDRPSVERLQQLLREIVEETHLIIKMNSVAAKADSQASFVGLLLSPHGDAAWAHVGDSRLYHFTDGKCVARTNDAAYVEHLVGKENVPPDAAKAHRKSKVLSNLMGNPVRAPFVTVGSHTGLKAGDGFLLASDGLWHYFADAELGAATYRATPRQAAEMLIKKAGERSQGKGGNCTMAIVKLVKPAEQAPGLAVKAPVTPK